MNDDRMDKLIDGLFTLAKSLNAVVDRLDIVVDQLFDLADRQAENSKANDAVFTKMREEFWKKVIEFEVNQEIKKNKKGKISERF